jgi:hypothetical protein
MSEPETETEELGVVWDAPNQQVVRADASPPWQETAAAPVEPDGNPAGSAAATAPEGLDAMSKDELLAYAQELGVTPANAGMTKDELKAGIEARLAEGGG